MIAKARTRLLQYIGVALAALPLAVARLHTHSMHCYGATLQACLSTVYYTYDVPRAGLVDRANLPARRSGHASPRLSRQRRPLLGLMKALLPPTDKALPTAVPTSRSALRLAPNALKPSLTALGPLHVAEPALSASRNHLATPPLTASTVSRPGRPSAATPAFSSSLIRSGVTA